MITIAPIPAVHPEPDIQVSFDDARLIAKISGQIGRIEAIRVTRWLTKASLKSSKEFVDTLHTESTR